MATKNDSVQDLQNLLKEDNVDDKNKNLPIVNDPNEEEELEEELEEDKDENGNEEENQNEEENEEELDKEENKEKEKSLRVEIPNYKAVVKKYPDLFKDFPSFKHVFFQQKEYRELFPTVQEAKETVEALGQFSEIEDNISQGTVESTVKALNSLDNLSDGLVSKLATNFIPSLKKVDQELYFKTVTPVLVDFIRQTYNNGVRHENENLKNAALVVSMNLFGDSKVATGEKDLNLGTTKKEGEEGKDSKLEQERQSFRRERYTAFYNDVVSIADNKLMKIVEDGLDTNKTMSSGMKDLIIEKVLKEINTVLETNGNHTARMNSLWKKAGDNNFPSSSKDKIIAAYLTAAKEIMPRIRAKVRANVLGIRERRSENETGRKEVREEPRSNAGGGRKDSQTPNNDKSDKDIDWSKTTDMDYLNGKITYKK